jgi:membrane-bound ClpP family serine protease
MNRNFRHLFILLLFSGFSLQASAFNYKIKPNVKDAVGNGGNDDANEVKLPIGLPFQITDPSTASGTGNEDGGVPTEQSSKIVYTFDLPDGQGPESKHETHSAFEQARSLNAACVLIRMSSMSSALDAAVNISNEISDYDRPVMVYVNDRAISANTLISMAADTKNAGLQNKNKRQQAQVKKHSASESETGIQNRYSYIDETNCTNGSSVMQLNKNQFTSGQNGDLDDVLTQAGLNNYTVVHYSPGFFAQLLDWCMKPFVSLILILLIALGMRAQLTSAFPGPATFLLLISLSLFAVPLFVGGLTGSAEFASAIFLAIAFLVSARKKYYGKTFRFILAGLFMVALTMCQTENFSQLTNWSVPAITLLLTSATFLAGWMIPSYLGKLFRKESNAEFVPAS